MNEYAAGRIYAFTWLDHSTLGATANTAGRCTAAGWDAGWDGSAGGAKIGAEGMNVGSGIMTKGVEETELTVCTVAPPELD